MPRKKRHVAHRREIRFFRVMFLISVLSQTEGGDSIHRIFKRLQYDCILQKAERLLEEEESCSFADVCKNFKVIDEDTVPVIVDTDLLEKIQNKTANWNDVQMGSISIRRSCLEKWKVQEIAPGKGLYRWTLGYDAFIGYMKGVLEMVKQ